MKKNTMFFTIFLAVISLCIGQQQTADGGYIISGTTYSYITGYVGAPDALIYKLDGSGNIDWFDHYGGLLDEQCFKAIQTGDGGYAFVVSGMSFSFPYFKPSIFKLDGSGNVVWRATFSGPEEFVYGFDLEQTSDGGFIVTGASLPFGPPKGNGGPINAFLWKLDAGGGTQWSKTYGGSQEDAAFAVCQTSDGGYVMAGGSESYTHGQLDFLVYKLNASGAKQWRKNYGGMDWEYAFSIEQTADGGYVMAGDGDTYTHGGCDLLVYKLNAAGQKQWRKNYGGSNCEHYGIIRRTSEGGYILGGDTSTYTNGGCDLLVYKLNASGAKQWRKNFGGVECEHISQIRQTSDGGYMLFGETASYTHGTDDYDFIMYKLSASGAKQWRKNYGGIDDEYASLDL